MFGLKTGRHTNIFAFMFYSGTAEVGSVSRARMGHADIRLPKAVIF
jgi:hypothetical protein